MSALCCEYVSVVMDTVSLDQWSSGFKCGWMSYKLCRISYIKTYMYTCIFFLNKKNIFEFCYSSFMIVRHCSVPRICRIQIHYNNNLRILCFAISHMGWLLYCIIGGAVVRDLITFQRTLCNSFCLIRLIEAQATQRTHFFAVFQSILCVLNAFEFNISLGKCCLF